MLFVRLVPPFLPPSSNQSREVLIVSVQANAYAPNWGQVIFQSAREMDQNNLFRQRIDEYQSKVGEEVEWWTRRRAEIQEGFMKELDAEQGTTTTTTTPAAHVVAAAAATPVKTEPAAAPAAPSVTAVSDDDGVLVEAEVPKVNSGTSSVKKKKKGKK